MVKLSREYEFLLRSLAIFTPAADRSHGMEAGFPDWQVLFWLASWHRLSGALRAVLRRGPDPVDIPADFLQSLEGAWESSRASYQRRETELVKILGALESEAIAVILLKGLALAEPVYGDPGARPMGDLDLLVPEDRLDQAQRLVCEMGFHRLGTPGRRQEHSLEHGRHGPRLRSEDGLCDVEIHRHIVDRVSPAHFPVCRLWDRARRERVAGLEVHVLAPADLLTHLGLSFFFDRLLFYQSNFALGQLFDMAMVIRHHRGEIEWEQFVSDALGSGHAWALHTALWTTKALLGAEVPRAALARLAPSGTSTRRLERFAQQKVLEVRPWFFHQLVTVDDDRPSNWARSALRRVFFNRAYLEQKYALPEGTPGGVHLFLRHLLDLLLLTKRYLLEPTALTRELGVDRWMLSMMGDPEAPGRDR